MSRLLYSLLLVPAALVGCAGTGPSHSLNWHLDQRQLLPDAPVVLVDLDDTVYEREVEQPMVGASACLQDLARDHLIVYLTARPTYAKVPWVTQNRSDSIEFLESSGFPRGPLFTSSFSNWLIRGEGDGKVQSLHQLREFGVERVHLAVGDRPHDLEAYLENAQVDVDHAVIIFIEDETRADDDRAELPEQALSNRIGGSGPAWPRILDAYRSGALEGHRTWIISQGPPNDATP